MRNQPLRIAWCISLFSWVVSPAVAQSPVAVTSPDGLLNVTITTEGGRPSYTVQYREITFVEASPLGLKTSIGDFTSALQPVGHHTTPLRETYTLTKAKVSRVDYEANELVYQLINPAQDTLHLVFRVSNHDVAFAYRLTTKARVTNVLVEEEATGFDLPAGTTTFLTPQAPPMTGWEKTKPSYEEEYTYDEPVGTPSKYGVGYTFPALFKVGDHGWVLISETGVDSRYVGSRLGEGTREGFYPLRFPQPGENNGIGGTSAAMAMPAHTPWRTLTVGETLQPIVETTVAFDVVTPRYEATRSYEMGRATWSWIVWQDNSINYDDQVKFIDLAADLRFEYVLIDNWWDRNIGRDRMEALVAYAASKNVGVLLWYNSNGYWNDAPQTPQDCMNTALARKKEMAWLQRIGVKGLKVDFFGGDKQPTLQLYEDILADANAYGLTITFHGCTLPRGWERMYPNFVTAEAVLASENLIFQQRASDLHAYHATILPFTRNTVAAMDFAPVFFNKRLTRDQQGGSIRRTTDAFEMATAVLYSSPVQHFGITPNNLDEQPDYVLDFLREVPTVWDETVFVEGYPGQHCVMARRKGMRWYVVAVNGEKRAKQLTVSLPMLAGREVQLLYDEKGRTAGFATKKVGSNGRFKLSLLPEGGAVIVAP
ncbi:glycoside hydrolase family 97 protein [Catalinimonas alkaloidigena]|uniref:glycoside hydrolase family 97 protein n=1 Tax=Catalinimonas alkaloidigena TaxID=1075417 RepID=UPI001FE176B5|nr:glycoside hydrolase family 97 protein [Catalinimonas alkaloidigena]